MVHLALLCRHDAMVKLRSHSYSLQIKRNRCRMYTSLEIHKKEQTEPRENSNIKFSTAAFTLRVIRKLITAELSQSVTEGNAYHGRTNPFLTEAKAYHCSIKPVIK